MNGKTISTRKETVDEIMQALSISPENPLCILHQEIAKTFLINSDPGKKYQVHIHLPIVSLFSSFLPIVLHESIAIGSDQTSI